MSFKAGSFVEVALPVPVLRAFTYRVAGAAPAPGTRVLVPFRNRKLVGWVLGGGVEVPRVRDVAAVLDAEPSVGPELMELARWIADYYVASPGIVLRTMLPARMARAAGRRPAPARRSVVRVVRSVGTLAELDRVFGRARRQREAYDRLVGSGGS
ncbi:MAG: primosomal protein N', partial [Gemmatimonadetes bacterium]|nr:primosomal protein N' [Gemmatimonadota bacterium]